MLNLPARFWSKVNKTESCWLWTGAKSAAGYGQIRIDGRKGKTVYAHRLIMDCHNDGFDVVVHHLCDTPECVNPDHLRIGTHADNIADKCRKNRQPHSENHWSTKLSNDDVKQLRQMFHDGIFTRSQLAQHFQISYQCVVDIILRRRWKHV